MVEGCFVQALISYGGYFDYDFNLVPTILVLPTKIIFYFTNLSLDFYLRALLLFLEGFTVPILLVCSYYCKCHYSWIKEQLDFLWMSLNIISDFYRNLGRSYQQVHSIETKISGDIKPIVETSILDDIS